VQYSDFLNSADTRRRYWARSYSGWPRVHEAQPNPSHAALATLDQVGRVSGLITQNVDNLHRRAGSRRVIDLHGVLEKVRCLECGDVSSRADLQRRLQGMNAGWFALAGTPRPDGDVALDDAATSGFNVPDCRHCGGLLKPDVVFFGENVPRSRVAAAATLVAESDALLVVGSSLMVFSGFRFVRQARAAGKTIAILNRGRTRGDEFADIRINDDCGPRLAGCVADMTAAGKSA